jgi:hypothetical protein
VVSKFKTKNSRGQSLTEVLISLAIGGIVSLGLASVFTFGVEQFQILVDQNQAETSLLSSAFYLRSWLSQAVKINCHGLPGAAPNQYGPLNGANLASSISDASGPQTLNLSSVTGTNDELNTPTQIARGKMDCREVPSSPTEISNDGGSSLTNPLVGYHWAYKTSAPPRMNIIANFIRDAGDGPAGGPYYSQYLPSVILFSPPSRPTDPIYNSGTGNKSGVLWFFQASAGTANLDTSRTAFMKFDHIVDVGVVQNTVDPNNPYPTGDDVSTQPGTQNLRSLSIRIVARYHLSATGIKDYRSGIRNPAPGYATYKDIEMTVPIGFRNNYLGVSSTGSGSSERLYGSLYFFKFSAPPMASFAQF